MHLKKRFHVLSLAAVAAAMMAVPAAASAESGTCVFQGLAGDITPGVMLVGGSGSYTFSTPPGSATTQCNYNGGPMAPSTIVSAGNFTNTICGTGTATGNPASATTIDQGNDGVKEITSADYTIAFRATQGTLDIKTVNGRPETGGDVNGHVSITPSEGSCTTGVTAFEVAGAFTASW